MPSPACGVAGSEASLGTLYNCLFCRSPSPDRRLVSLGTRNRPPRPPPPVSCGAHLSYSCPHLTSAINYSFLSHRQSWLNSRNTRLTSVCFFLFLLRLLWKLHVHEAVWAGGVGGGVQGQVRPGFNPIPTYYSLCNLGKRNPVSSSVKRGY